MGSKSPSEFFFQFMGPDPGKSRTASLNFLRLLKLREMAAFVKEDRS